MSYFLCPIKEGQSNTALILPEEKISYRELNDLVEDFQGRLKSLKVDKICLYYPLEKDLIPLLFAAFRENISLFIVNPKLPFSFVERKAKELGITFFLSPDKFTLEDLKKIKPCAILGSTLHEDQTLYLLTSGSTHEPKIAALSLGGLYYNALGSIPSLFLSEGDVWLLSLPIYHVSGIALLFRTFLAKAALALYPKDFTLKGITHLSYVPTQLYRLIEEKNLSNLISLKCLLLGGAAIPPHLYQEGKKLGIPLFLTYGLTEMSSSVLITNTPVFEDGVFYLGDPLPFREMKIKEDGEICVKGKTLFQGYAPNDSCLKDWFFTKDLGKYKKPYGFAIFGRKDRMFISGGENIQPEEIERALLEHPLIQEAYVIPIEDKEFGQVPLALIRMVKALPKDSLQAYLQEKLPSYKIPREFHPIPKEIENGLKPNFSKFFF